MSANAKETKYMKQQMTEDERCLFTTNHGHRCRNPHLGNASRHCFLHEGRNQKLDEAEVQAVADQLLAKNVGLATREDVNRITSQLYTMVAEKRVSRQDGSLLAYIASVLLQTITPVRRKAVAPERVEFVESVAEPIPATRAEFNRKVAERFAQEPPVPGRTIRICIRRSGSRSCSNRIKRTNRVQEPHVRPYGTNVGHPATEHRRKIRKRAVAARWDGGPSVESAGGFTGRDRRTFFGTSNARQSAAGAQKRDYCWG